MTKINFIIIVLLLASCASPIYTNRTQIVVYKDQMKSDSIIIPTGTLWTSSVPSQAKKYKLRAIAVIDTNNIIKDSRLIKPLNIWKSVGYEGYYISPERFTELSNQSGRAVVHNRMLNAAYKRKSYQLYLGWKSKNL